MWVDHFGDMEIINHKTGKVPLIIMLEGDKARVEFTKCGWFSKGQYEVKGWILDPQGRTRVSLSGKWSKQLDAASVAGTVMSIMLSISSEYNLATDFVDTPMQFQNPVWVHTNSVLKTYNLTTQPDIGDPWKLSPFAQELNYLDDNMRRTLPPTDARLRPGSAICHSIDFVDRMALQQRDMATAG